MDVVLDTNIYVQDFTLESSEFSLLFDYLKKTDSRIILPQLVYQEIRSQYIKRANTFLSDSKKCIDNLNKLLVSDPLSNVDLNINECLEAYIEMFYKKLNIERKDIFPYKNSYLTGLVNRSINKERPFSEKGKEFCDSVLWLTVLDIANKTNHSKRSPLVFISSDTNAFGDISTKKGHEKDRNILHRELLKEIESKKLSLQYFSSISDFIKSQSTIIDFVNPSWILNQVTNQLLKGLVEKDVTDFLHNPNSRQFKLRGWEGYEFSGYLNLDCTEIDKHNLHDFYVYEKIDNSLFVEAVFYIEIEIEFNNIYNIGHRIENFYDYTHDDPDERKHVFEYPELEVVFGITVIENEVAEIEVLSWGL